MDPGIKTFPCVGCGSQLAFKPGTQALVCDRCGTEQPVPDGSAPIQEYGLHEAMAKAITVDPASLVDGGREVRCQGCGAISVITGTADRCAYCDAPVVLIEDAPHVLKPESVLPFGIEQRVAGVKFRTWIASRWFAPNDLVLRARQEAIDGVYLPYWTYDSRATAEYTGERGEHYHVDEDYTDKEGNTRTRSVRKTRWHDVEGRVDHTFDDTLVCASHSLPRVLTEGLEPWDLDGLKPFDPSYLAGFQAERYNVELEAGWVVAQKRMESQLRVDIDRDIGGDEQRIRSMEVHHDGVTFKHLLLPLWISSYRYEDKVYRVIVNARTGAISGDRPYSQTKIILAALAIFALLVFFCGGFSCCSSVVGAGSQ